MRFPPVEHCTSHRQATPNRVTPGQLASGGRRGAAQLAEELCQAALALTPVEELTGDFRLGLDERPSRLTTYADDVR